MEKRLKREDVIGSGSFDYGASFRNGVVPRCAYAHAEKISITEEDDVRKTTEFLAVIRL